MNPIAKYTLIQKMFEAQKRLIEKINDPKFLIKNLEKFKQEGLEYYREKNTDAFQYSNRLYQVTFDKAKKVGADLSNYQESLEAYLN